MIEQQIKQYVTADRLRRKIINHAQIKSMLEISQSTMKVTLTINLTEESSTLIFRETYESIRQLGDALWGIKGYEPRDHEISIEILKEIPVKNKLPLNHLLRFKTIRNDANYRGFRVTYSQAKEILEFWQACSKEIIEYVKSKTI